MPDASERISPETRRTADRVPPGQTQVTQWPVLHYGDVPRLDLKAWRFRIFGLVEEEWSCSWDEIRAMPRIDTRSDFHCVTKWSRLGMTWRGVPLLDLLARVRIRPEARFAMFHAANDFTANLPLEYLMRECALLAFEADGQPLTPEHGGPVRAVIPGLYAWKSAKWVAGLELIGEDAPGFWEQNGYHMRGDPWGEERYG